jgi:hypothetical protein
MATRPENWEAVKALFEPALEEDLGHGSSFLKERCPDASLRNEVERLLAEHDQAGAFLSTRLWQIIDRGRGQLTDFHRAMAW